MSVRSGFRSGLGDVRVLGKTNRGFSACLAGLVEIPGGKFSAYICTGRCNVTGVKEGMVVEMCRAVDDVDQTDG